MTTRSTKALAAAGQPISELMSRALGNPDLISLAAGFVDQESLPVEALRVATERVLSNAGDAQLALQYGANAGLPHLRDLILQRMHIADDFASHDLSIDRVVITAGSNQLLSLIADSVLNKGDIALCAAPTYLVWMGIVKAVGAESRGVLSDEYGIVPEALESQLQQLDSQGELQRVKLIYLVPYFDNPRCTTLTTERRSAIVEIAERWSKHHRIHVIADNAYRELRYRGDDVADTLTHDPAGETVIIAGTFSKSFAPGIRLGFGVLPTDLVQPVRDLKSNLDFGSPNLNQHIMAEVIDSGLYGQHLTTMRDGYRVKLQAMLDAADECFSSLEGVNWLSPDGGLYVWLELPEHIDAGSGGELFDVALEEGMFYVPGEFCFAEAGEPVRRNCMRLSFGVQSPARIREGMAALARAIRKVSALEVAH